MSKIRSIHFGGGTPTFLSGKILRDDHLDFQNKYSFKRVSRGIQDFDNYVQV